MATDRTPASAQPERPLGAIDTPAGSLSTTTKEAPLTAQHAPSALEGARLGILAALLEGDAALAHDQVLDLMGGGVDFPTVVEEILIPIQADIGHRWSRGEYRIAEEHAATAGVETLLSLLVGAFSQPPGAPHVVVASAEGDDHSLPARFAAAALSYNGWRVTFLGGNMPAEHLGTYLAEVEPAALVLSCAMASHLPGARASIEAAHRAGVPVLVGGRAFGSDDTIARSVGADGWAAGIEAIDETLRSWQPDTATSEAGARPVSPGLEEVRARRPILVERAVGIIGGDRPAEVGRDVQLLLDALEAALLLGDAGPVADYAAWHAELHGAETDIATLVTALREALEGSPALAMSYLETA